MYIPVFIHGNTDDLILDISIGISKEAFSLLLSTFAQLYPFSWGVLYWVPKHHRTDAFTKCTTVLLIYAYQVQFKILTLNDLGTDNLKGHLWDYELAHLSAWYNPWKLPPIAETSPFRHTREDFLPYGSYGMCNLWDIYWM